VRKPDRRLLYGPPGQRHRHRRAADGAGATWRRTPVRSSCRMVSPLGAGQSKMGRPGRSSAILTWTFPGPPAAPGSRTDQRPFVNS